MTVLVQRALMSLEEQREKKKSEKWVNKYSPNHQILLVGEGDFSFSSSLAKSFGSAFNILATSFDTYDVLIKKYKYAKSNLEILFKLGASILHGVDATKMKFHTDLRTRKFDRIIFNFPHAGFHGKEDNTHMIEMHRSLVSEFFRNARGMLRANGEIHVNHKNKRPFCLWNIQELASKNSLALTERVDFKIEDYPGYNNKRGHGNMCDEPFFLGKCSTFKFVLSYTSRVTSHFGLTCQRPQLVQIGNPSTSIVHFNYPQTGHGTQLNHNPQHFEFLVTEQTSYGFGHAQKGYNTRNRNFEHAAPPVITRPQQFHRHEQQSTSSDFSYPNTGHIKYTNPNFGYGELPLTIMERRKEHISPVFPTHIGYTTEVSGRNEYNVGSHISELRLDAEREMAMVPGRTLNGDIYVASALHRMNSFRRSLLQRYGKDAKEEPFSMQVS